MDDVALTQAQIDAYEHLKSSGWWAWLTGKTGSGILTGEQYTVLLLLTISDQLSQLTQAITGISSPQPETVNVTVSGGTNTIETPAVTRPSVVISWDPERLDEIISLTEALRGAVSDTVTQFPLTVPANGSVTMNIPPPAGNVAKLFGPLQITTTDVAAQVSVAASVDGNNVIGQQGFIIGPSTKIKFHQYVVAKQTGMLFTLTNPSSSDVTVYFNGEMMVMTQDFYNKYYNPILQGAFSFIQNNFGIS